MKRYSQRFLCVVLCATIVFAVAAPAWAQPKAPSAAALLQQIQADAQAALADADGNGDKIASTCYSAIVVATTAKLKAQSTTGGGLLTVFQKARDLVRLNASPNGTDLIIGCAPLVQDAKLNLLQFFTQIGAAVLLKGVLVP